MDTALPGLIVTGASGFVGRHFLQAAAGKFRIFCLARRSQQEAGIPPNENIRWAQIDVGKWDHFPELAECIRDHGGADYLIHLAGYYDFSNTPQPEYELTNIAGTKNVLELGKLVGIKQFCFAGSLVVCAFPPQGGNPVTESTPATEDFPYAHSKRISEELCRDYIPFFKVVIFRMGAVYSDWCEYPPLYMFLKTWFSTDWNARILGGRGNSAIPYIHVQDLNNFLFRILDRCNRFEDCVVLLASPDRAESHFELFDASTRHYFGRSIRPIFMPRTLAAIGIALRFYLCKLFRRSPFERPWMVRYIDRQLRVDNSKTQRLLDWKPSKRNLLTRRLLFLVENLKSHPEVWHLKNEAAAKKIALRPRMIVGNALEKHRDEIIEKVVTFIRSPEHSKRFAHYQQLSPQALSVWCRLIYQLITTVVKTHDRGLIRSYARALAYHRFLGGFPVEEVCDAILSFSGLVTQHLKNLEALQHYEQRIHHDIELSLQMAVDEIEDYYETLESQSPEVVDELRARRKSLPSPEMERVVLQLKDICRNLTEDLLDLDEIFPHL